MSPQCRRLRIVNNFIYLVYVATNVATCSNVVATHRDPTSLATTLLPANYLIKNNLVDPLYQNRQYERSLWS